MTAPKYAALREAIVAHLDGLAGFPPVYSPRAPQPDDAGDGGDFPFVVVSQATESPWNTKGTRGAQFLVQVDAYARSTAIHSAENIITALHAQTRAALEWHPLTVTGAHWVDTQFESMTLGWDDEGKTRRFVSLYRVTLDEG